ncbi:ATP/GTP-binding protein [Streptomyces sp. NPDC093225]|uniref:ATP/GTP-binding protein n=1 Tax=Streptomyces sp. NPDC093225 TaxID=3366034 RepID=UPI0038295F5D
MDSEGTQRQAGVPIPAPAAPGDAPRVPPPPAHAPAAGPSLVDWLRTPRPAAAPGVWRFGHTPRPERAADEVPDRALLSSAVISFLACALLWSLLRNGLVPYRFWTLPVRMFTPNDWWQQTSGEPLGLAGYVASWVWELLVDIGLLIGFGRLGNWRLAWQRLVVARGAWAQIAGVVVLILLVMRLIDGEQVPVRGLVAQLFRNDEGYRVVDPVINFAVVVLFSWLGGLFGLVRGLAGGRRAPAGAGPTAAPAPAEDPAAWPELRAAGLAETADRLGSEAAGGGMTDVDYARIRRAWLSVRADPSRLRAFAEAVRAKGAGACVHPSGVRDLPARAARHDLFTGQVRLGTVADAERNPYARRGTGLALDPALLGTSLLAVGPSGAGKTGRLVRPVVESLALQALAGQAAVIAVGPAGGRLGPDGAYDVVVRLGDPDSVYDLDLYGGTTDPDEAAGLLAEALAGDVPGADARRAATALAQLLGPFRAAYGRFPAVPELRLLLDGAPAALGALREHLDSAGDQAQLRELDARERQAGHPGDPAPLLADRVALLDRPAFAGFFDTSGKGRPFSLRSLEHPLRVRVDLPERGHADASRMLARLLLAQFTASAAARADRSLFACLVLDDAAQALTPETVRGLGRLRSAHAGVVLTLRTLDDVPEALRTPLFGAVGCRMAFSGVTTWDGQRFAEAWGTEWVETRDVTSRTVFADQPLTRAIHSFRKLVTGKAVTTDAVTVRQVERERWSASDLAHAVPPGHAVLSVTSVRGERAAPLLVDLEG